MSTDYHFACAHCKQAVWVGQDGMSGFAFYYGDERCMKTALRFLDEHKSPPHAISFISEHVVDSDDGYEVIEWDSVPAQDPSQ